MSINLTSLYLQDGVLLDNHDAMQFAPFNRAFLSPIKGCKKNLTYKQRKNNL